MGRKLIFERLIMSESPIFYCIYRCLKYSSVSRLERTQTHKCKLELNRNDAGFCTVSILCFTMCVSALSKDVEALFPL